MELIFFIYVDFVCILNGYCDLLCGCVVLYDIEYFGLVFFFVVEDVCIMLVFWDVVKVLGGVNVNLYIMMVVMLECVVFGESLFVYNVIGLYVVCYVDCNLVFVIKMLIDYILVVMCVVFIVWCVVCLNVVCLWFDFMFLCDG